ncbi:structural maintenance of chromosomes flexible hinge domain-containing protein 1 isoform X2 [Brachyhypopomus gauderio]|uniref:structural maintenance of chromosomes flexible hinge domain-containing protein 1 isoform X2 n=1 Tax=Brachyhypopomus gauderio TaxID=698409 RepID=UPI00404375BA
MAECGAPRPQTSHVRGSVSVFDCRPDSKAASEKVVGVDGVDYNEFLRAVRKEFSISGNETFVLTTTDRREINADVYGELTDGKTLHLLHSVDQELVVATQERIKYLPHYHTIVQSGQYEYYASEGHNALPYAFAELIDNALSATSKNPQIRSIDIRLLFDDSQGGPAVVVMDNGRGMTSKELNNWAVYRLSKFNRGTFQSDHSGYVRPKPVPRSLNSDISYFGVGGKQAVFYIGQSVRIISKPLGSPDVHEFVMSKEDFQKKEQNKEEIYSGVILNRKPGDDSHVNMTEERFLQSLVREEETKDSFTAVVITAVQPEHVTYLKQDFNLWTRELAHIYHYYVHGIHGNDMRSTRIVDSTSNIDIHICLIDRSPRLPRLLNLREVDKDMQTLYINSSVAEFEFKASRGSDALVEGVIRYHPFLYDRETYPEDPYAQAPAPENDDDDDCFVLQADGRGKRPIFQCYWNGRLIPYSSVDEFEWCARPKKGCAVPLECYNRISGVLFTNDCFQVSTNKLTYMDLELQLRDKDTIFTRVLHGQEQRVKINREFMAWMKDCHERYDKQVKFLECHGSTTRTDVPTKRLQSPWACFKAIKWDGKTYKSGQNVKSVKTQPILFGSIVQFLLYGDHEGDVYATGGHVQIALEPKELYNEVRTIPISKIDRQATAASIKKSIEDELAKLPDQLRIKWPEGNPWPEKAVQPAGTPMGPIQVEILNKKGESMSRLPVANVNAKKLLIDLKVIWHSPKGDIQTNSHIGVHSPKWEYWFKVMENLNKLGKYTLHLQTILSETLVSEWAGKRLPHYTLHFSIKENSAATFVLPAVPSPVQVGVPFSLPVEFKDEFGHSAQPPSDIKPQIECSSLELSYERTTSSDTALIIQDLRARGRLKDHQEKVHTVKVIMPGLRQDSQSFQMSVHPGPPHLLVVMPEGEVSIENGTAAGFSVEVQDEFQNITTHSKLIVRCQLLGAPDLTVDAVDCSNTGSGMLLTKPIQLKSVGVEQVLTAKFGIPNQKVVSCVERTLRVLPSSRVSRVEVYRQEEDSEDIMVLQNMERIDWTAGDTLECLRFRLYDEGGRLVPLTATLANNIKVNWTSEVKVDDLLKGMLPSVLVPTKAQREHFYQVAFRDQHTVDTSFTIVARPDEPERLRVTLSETTVRMGEILAGNIYVEVIDQYGNKSDALSADSLQSISVSSEKLDTSTLKVEWQNSTENVVVRGVRFSAGIPGPRELCFKYQEFEEFARVKVTPGPPVKITLLDAPEMPIHVFNGRGLNTPFLLQLCDGWDNPVPDQRVVIAIKTLSPQLKVKSSVMSQPVDPEGRASFKLETVTAARGEHEVEFRGSFSRNSIPGPVVKLNVMADPSNPVTLNVEYDSDAVLTAGDTFPVFKVTVVSEEGGPVKGISPADLSMLLWQGSASGTRPPPGATTFKCSKPTGKRQDDHFYFRDKDIPERVGKYMVQFVLVVGKTRWLWSSQIALDVVPNKPVKLVPETTPPTPVVSNSNTLANRTLLERLCLNVMDKYNNPAGMGFNGQVVVKVLSAEGEDAKDLPRFHPKAKTLSYSLTNGLSTITNLALMENSPGDDGAEYKLQFCPVIQGTAPPLTPFTITFRFYNDAESQKVMAAMSKKRDQLSRSIEMYKDILETNKQLISELKGQLNDATKKESQLRTELNKIGLDVSKLSGKSAVEGLMAQKKVDLERILSQPRRKCTMPDPFKGSPDVLGKIAHLAQVEDDDVAKVISWHLLGDMDCVVTVTTAAARKIYDETQGRQQVMPLETVFWRPNNRPLPHIRNGGNLFRPVGNPVFVRDLLIFPEHAENCNMVFASLLGDTILVDDLDSANHYRRGSCCSSSV